MLPKQARKDIRDVLERYNGESDSSNAGWALTGLAAVGGIWILGALLGAVIPPASIGLITLVGIGTTVFAGMRLAVDNITRTRKNKAGQSVHGKRKIRRALRQMERDLSRLFAKASRPDADHRHKAAFRMLAATVQRDVKKLSATFNIVGGGDYALTVSVRKQPPLTLEAALRKVGA